MGITSQNPEGRSLLCSNSKMKIIKDYNTQRRELLQDVMSGRLATADLINIIIENRQQIEFYKNKNVK